MKGLVYIAMKTDAQLQVMAEEMRIKTLRTLERFGSGHIGGAMSIIETLAALYGDVMRYDPGDPAWDRRDRLVMSKGHAGPALYAALSMCGFFPEEMLAELNVPGGRLPSHCDMNRTPGVDMTTGSLGQGMSTAIGLALGCRMNGWDSRTYLILGDGECDEGQVWEGAIFARHYRLDNLIAFVDRNMQQLDGYVDKVMDTGDMAAKFSAFGWSVQSIDGHDPAAIRAAAQKAAENAHTPSAIILKTVKGYGCNFAEGVESNHNMSFTKEQIDSAVAEVEARLAAARRGR
jgi:transketolase